MIIIFMAQLHPAGDFDAGPAGAGSLHVGNPRPVMLWRMLLEVYDSLIGNHPITDGSE
jgi:hypothetical protein